MVIILILTTIILIINFASTLITGIVLKLSRSVSISIAILISQIGEFSFVLAKEGLNYGLITNEFLSIFLGVSILTMSVTPFLEKLTPKIIEVSKMIV